MHEFLVLQVQYQQNIHTTSCIRGVILMGEKLCLVKTHFFCMVFTPKEVGIPWCAVNVVGLVKFLIGGCCVDAVCT